MQQQKNATKLGSSSLTGFVLRYNYSNLVRDANNVYFCQLFFYCQLEGDFMFCVSGCVMQKHAHGCIFFAIYVAI